MSQLQYIGARYVPVWYENTVDQSANWQSNVEYEPLTFVTETNNHLYLSKKTVPDTIGHPADNMEYWLDMGVFTNAQIAELTQRVDDIELNIGDLDDLQTTDKSNIVNAINSILTGTRKYYFFGDSYGSNYTVDGVTYTGWLDKMAAALNVSASQVNGQAVSGYGFCGSSGTSKWLTLVNSLSVDTSVTDVAFIGGDNDIVYALTDLSAAVASTVAAARVKFPKAKIWIGFCAVDLSDNDTRAVLTAYEMYSKFAAANGCSFMASIAYCLYDVGLLRLPSHPNNSGTSRLANAIATVLLGGQYFAGVHTKEATNDTSDAIVAASGVTEQGRYYISVIDGQINLGIRGAASTPERVIVKFGSGVPVTCDLQTTTLNIAKLTDVPIGHQGLIVLGTVAGFLKASLTEWKPASIMICWYRGYIQLKILGIESGVGYYNIASMTELMFPATRFTIPTPLYSSYI